MQLRVGLLVIQLLNVIILGDIINLALEGANLLSLLMTLLVELFCLFSLEV